MAKINNTVLNFGNAKRLYLFCLLRQNKIHGFTWADQDWIGPIIFKILLIRSGTKSIFADQDWTRSEKFHSPFISAKQHNWSWTVLLENNRGNIFIKMLYFINFLDFIRNWTLLFLNYLCYAKYCMAGLGLQSFENTGLDPKMSPTVRSSLRVCDFHG